MHDASVHVYLETHLTNLCLCVCGSWSFSKIFHSYGVVTYTEHLWPLSTDGSLACHTYCDTGYPFTLVIMRTRASHSCYWAFSSGAVTACFNYWVLSHLGFKNPTFRMRGERSNRLRHHCGSIKWILNENDAQLIHYCNKNQYWFFNYTELDSLYFVDF